MILRLRITLALCLLVCFNACTNDAANDNLKSLSIRQKSVFIPLDSIGLATYTAEPFVFHAKDQDFLYAYNRPNSSVDIFNLTEKKFAGRIPLSREGPDQVNKFYHLQVQSADSIYIMGGRILYLINEKGKVIRKYDLSFSQSDDTADGFFYAPGQAYVNIEDNLLRGYFSRPDPRGDLALSQPLLGKYDLRKNELSFAQVFYPEVIKGLASMYNWIRPNLYFEKDKLYYNFPLESTIYTYDFTTEKTSSHEAKSRFSENIARNKSVNSSYNYLNEGTLFKRFQRYPGQSYFYRTHWRSQPRKTLNGELSDASTKPGYLMIFNEEMEIIQEIELDQNCHVDLSFSTKEGIFFWAKDGENEDEVKLCQYIIQPAD